MFDKAPGVDGVTLQFNDAMRARQAENLKDPATVEGAAVQEAIGEARNPALSVTYNGDGSVSSTTENGVVTTFSYNGDGTVHTQTRAGTTRTFSYDSDGNVTGAI